MTALCLEAGGVTVALGRPLAPGPVWSACVEDQGEGRAKVDAGLGGPSSMVRGPRRETSKPAHLQLWIWRRWLHLLGLLILNKKGDGSQDSI